MIIENGLKNVSKRSSPLPNDGRTTSMRSSRTPCRSKPVLIFLFQQRKCSWWAHVSSTSSDWENIQKRQTNDSFEADLHLISFRLPFGYRISPWRISSSSRRFYSLVSRRYSTTILVTLTTIRSLIWIEIYILDSKLKKSMNSYSARSIWIVPSSWIRYVSRNWRE